MKIWLLAFGALAVGRAIRDPPAVNPTTAKTSCIIPFELTEANVPIVSAVININPDRPEVHPSARRLAIDMGAAHTVFFVSNSIVGHLAKILPHATVEERLAARLRSSGYRKLHIERHGRRFIPSPLVLSLTAQRPAPSHC
jgi:hypothetical protein